MTLNFVIVILDKCRNAFVNFRHIFLELRARAIGISGLEACLRTLALAAALLKLWWSLEKTLNMLRISIADKKGHRKLVLEGKLVEPWLGELRQSWGSAHEDLQGRKLVIDLTNVTVISHEGESALLEMMQQGAHFSCGGVLIRHMVRQLARRCGGKHQPPCSSHAND